MVMNTEVMGNNAKMGRKRGYQTFIRAQHRELALFLGMSASFSRFAEDIIAYYMVSMANFALSVHDAVQVWYYKGTLRRHSNFTHYCHLPGLHPP